MKSILAVLATTLLVALLSGCRMIESPMLPREVETSRLDEDVVRVGLGSSAVQVSIVDPATEYRVDHFSGGAWVDYFLTKARVEYPAKYRGKTIIILHTFEPPPSSPWVIRNNTFWVELPKFFLEKEGMQAPSHGIRILEETGIEVKDGTDR